MKAFFFLILVVLAIAAIMSLNKGGGAPVTPPPVDPAKQTPKYAADKVWTAEEVSGDPEGYMAWADAKVLKQIEDRQARLKTLTTRLSDIEKRQQALNDNLKDTENIRKRMGMAIQRSDDEERLPIKIGGREFTREEAVTIMEQSARYIEDRKPLAEKYDTTVARLRAAADALNKEIGDFKRLREKMELDADHVRLTKNMDDLSKLRKSEEEVASMAKALSSVTEESLTDLPDAKTETKVDFDSFMKK